MINIIKTIPLDFSIHGLPVGSFKHLSSVDWKTRRKHIFGRNYMPILKMDMSNQLSEKLDDDSSN